MSTLRIILSAALFFASFALCISCSSSPQLTDEQAAKLDTHLRAILQGTLPVTGSCAEVVLKDGTIAYNVIVRGNESEVRKAGFTPGSVINDILTLTIRANDILRLAALPSVRSIECGHTAQPQH